MNINWRKSKFAKLISILVIVALVYGLTYIPHKLVLINSDRVAEIVVTDGSTGRTIIINDKQDTDHMINNLNGIIFQKGKSSLGYMGYSFRTVIYNTTGKPVKKLIINSPDVIRYNGFFYTASYNQVDYEYIKAMFDKYPILED